MFWGQSCTSVLLQWDSAVWRSFDWLHWPLLQHYFNSSRCVCRVWAVGVTISLRQFFLHPYSLEKLNLWRSMMINVGYFKLSSSDFAAHLASCCQQAPNIRPRNLQLKLTLSHGIIWNSQPQTPLSNYFGDLVASSHPFQQPGLNLETFTAKKHENQLRSAMGLQRPATIEIHRSFRFLKSTFTMLAFESKQQFLLKDFLLFSYQTAERSM